MEMYKPQHLLIQTLMSSRIFCCPSITALQAVILWQRKTLLVIYDSRMGKNPYDYTLIHTSK